MKSRSIMLVSIFLVALYVAGNPQVVRADKLELKDGTQIDGIIKKVEKGQVTVEIGQETKVFNILDVSSMEFDTPHLPAETSRLHLEHFLASTEAQEVVGHIQAVEKSAADIRSLLDETKQEWAGRKTITTSDVPEWDATREGFRRALSRYQEVLNDFYFHVLGKVDEYGRLTKEGNELYVGVKGVFNVGSPLISKEMKQLPLKKYVPSNWYDTIYYSGYQAGYDAGFHEPRPAE